MKTASTKEIIEKLQAYEKENGIGAITSIATVCPGDRTVEYIFHVKDKNGNRTDIDISSVQEDDLFRQM